MGPERSTEFTREYWHKNKWEQTNCRAGNEVSPQRHEILEQPSRRRTELKNTTAFRAGLVQSRKGLWAMAAPGSRGKADLVRQKTCTATAELVTNPCSSITSISAKHNCVP